MEVAARFLASRPRTRWELERRLRRAGTAEPEIAAALDRLVEIEGNSQLLERDIAAVDMRLPDRMVRLRCAPRPTLTVAASRADAT